jgi:hypothetical protein
MTTFTQYPTLNVASFNEAAREAYNEGVTIERLHVQTTYLPALSLKIARIDSALRTAHYRLKDCVQSFIDPAAIGLQRIERAIGVLDRAPANSRPGVIARISTDVSRMVNLAGEAQVSLQRLLAPLQETVELDTTQRFLVQLNAEQEQVAVDIATLSARKAGLDQERQTLTQSISLIESKGFAQVGKDTILNAQQLSKLATATPEIAMLELAIEFAGKVLDEAQNLISYVSLTKARDVIRERIEQLMEQMATRVEDQRLVGLRQNLIMAIHRFDEHRLSYVAEFDKLVGALVLFLETHAYADLNEDDTRTALVDSAKALIDHLKPAVYSR